jgi:hypothetical protein
VNAELQSSTLAITGAELASAIIIGTVITNPCLPAFLFAPGERQLRVQLCDYFRNVARTGEPLLRDDSNLGPALARYAQAGAKSGSRNHRLTSAFDRFLPSECVRQPKATDQ